MATCKPLPITGGPVCKPRPHRAYLNASEDRLSGPSVLTHSFASRFGETFFGSAVLDENGFGSGGPCEGFRILVSMLNPFVDCGFEFSDVVEYAPPYTLSGDFGEEPLDEVEPGAGRRREVQDKVFVSCQPALHGRCLVGGVVVEDQMQIEMGGGLAIDLLEEGQELVCPMAGQTFADDFAGRDVEAAKSVVVPLRL